jgi:hypothetical protein
MPITRICACLVSNCCFFGALARNANIRQAFPQKPQICLVWRNAAAAASLSDGEQPETAADLALLFPYFIALSHQLRPMQKAQIKHAYAALAKPQMPPYLPLRSPGEPA